MKKWISFPRLEGRTSRQAHADLPEGTYERELGREGFFGPATHMYHRRPPTAWSGFEGPLRPRAFDTTRLMSTAASPWEADQLLHNACVKIRHWRQAASMECLVRNADGDELVFIHQGKGCLFCDYGSLEFGDGDYILLPRGTMWRVEIEEPLTALLIEATNEAYRLPDKGLVGPHAIFDEAILETPVIDEPFLDQQDDSPWTVIVKRRDQLSTIEYPFSPLDAVGWKGDLAPVRQWCQLALARLVAQGQRHPHRRDHRGDLLGVGSGVRRLRLEDRQGKGQGLDHPFGDLDPERTGAGIWLRGTA